ncbi:MAG: hypothetical protein IPP00_01660 [Actinomycetales bacterium]|uniref:Uncharacterized protein n=1 Tax=Candidatus Phosphoribacter hodrii TaxID=2953743 RepID=A0A9D7Y0B5_9MICO|nr:hypothetical protein [Candidatus Phosphoribacter hodrii]
MTIVRSDAVCREQRVSDGSVASTAGWVISVCMSRRWRPDRLLVALPST